jgi:hypothetical protein
MLNLSGLHFQIHLFKLLHIHTLEIGDALDSHLGCLQK